MSGCCRCKAGRQLRRAVMADDITADSSARARRMVAGSGIVGSPTFNLVNSERQRQRALAPPPQRPVIATETGSMVVGGARNLPVLAPRPAIAVAPPRASPEKPTVLPLVAASAPGAPQPAVKVARSRKLKQQYWAENGGCFEPIKVGGRLQSATCKICNDGQVYSATGGGSLAYHWEKHKVSVTVPPTAASAPAVAQLSQYEAWRKERALTVFMILCHLPVSLPDTEGLHFLASEWVPGLKLHSYPTIAHHHLRELYNTFSVDRLSDLLGNSKFSVVFDVWKAPKAMGSQKHKGYVGVAIFAIDREFEPRLAHVTVQRVKNHHDTTAILGVITAVLESLGIQVSDVVNSTSDNAKAECNVGEALVAAGALHHTHCWAHTAHLAVMDALKHVPIAKFCYKTVKHTIKLFARQRLLVEYLETAQLARHESLALHLLNDCKTRWNSSCSAMERFLILWPEIKTVLQSAAAAKTLSVKKRAIVADLVQNGEAVSHDLPFLLTLLNYVRVKSDVAEGDCGFVSEAIWLQDCLEAEMTVRVMYYVSCLCSYDGPPVCAVFCGKGRGRCRVEVLSLRR